MARAKLTITAPEDVWIGDLSRRFPAIRFRVLAAFSDESAGVGLVEVAGDDAQAAVGAMANYEDVTETVVLQHDERKVLAQFETTTPLLLLAVHDSGVPLQLPFTLENGEAVWELTASRERLSALGEQFDQLGVPYRVEWIHQHVEDEPLLTDSQREIVQAAVEEGYYDTPRTCTLTELAEKLGYAKSTVSETLHRAEERIVKEYVEEAPEAAHA